VPHIRSLKKLYAYGIKGKLWNWIKTSITNHKQKVCVNRIPSSWSNVISGIPQGSVLGPLFFIIYINDFSSNLRNFADDTKIFTKISRSNPISTLQEDINICEQWSLDWQLPFNTSKCKILHLGTFNPRHSYTMFGCTLEEVTEEKDLGIIIENQLKFDAQTTSVTNKSCRLLGNPLIIYQRIASYSCTNP